MEAMTAASIAALTVYDMVKGSSEVSRSNRSSCSPRVVADPASGGS
jgi:molybdenum cofactor biosynthesis enzyme